MSTSSPAPTAARPAVYLTPAQKKYRDSRALYRAFCGGRGAGKSFIGAYDLVRRVRRRRTYQVVAPTYPMLRDVTVPALRDVCRNLGVGSDYVRGDMELRIAGGVVVRLRSADNPDRLRGPNLSGVWIDEASLLSQEAYDVLLATLRERGEQGWLGCTFTPKGMEHWTYDLFGRGSRPDTELIRSHTSDNPFNPPGFAETLAHQYGPAYAAQELGGEFVTVEGAEWPPEFFDHAAFWFTDWPRGLTVRVIFLDPSKGSKDREGDDSAYVLYGRDASGVEYVEGDLSNRRNATEIVQTGFELAERFRPDGFGIESNTFQELFEPLFQAHAREHAKELPNLYLINNSVNKEVRIRRLTMPLSQRRMRFRRTPGTERLVSQLRGFPVAEHDDGPDALEGARRLAIRLLSGKR